MRTERAKPGRDRRGEAANRNIELTPGASEWTLRRLDLDCPERDLDAMARLDAAAGIPNVRPCLQATLQDGWLRRNPGIFRLLEDAQGLRGYVGVVPLREASYREFVRGTRYPFGEAVAGDVLTAAQEAAARTTGLYVWIESLSYADAEAARALGGFLFGHLSGANLRGILATSSGSRDEENCRWWGLTECYARGTCPTGTRRLWRADEESLAADAGHPLGSAVPVRAAFLEARRRFGAATALALSPAQRQVARLFYLAELTEREVGRELGMRPSTVRTHLKRIREKAVPVVGSPVSRAITAWLAEHPAELAGTDE